MILLYLISTLAFLAVEIFFTLLGIKQCRENNPLGLLSMFLGLNFLGLIIGFILLSNAKNQNGTNSNEIDNNEWVYDEQEDLWKRKN